MPNPSSVSIEPPSPSGATARAPALEACLLNYRPVPGVFDEMVMPSGELRAHWKTFGSFLAQCTDADFKQRADTIQRLLVDHGATYNIYDDVQGASRPWMLDLLPFIVAEQDWRRVQEGLDQRGRLLNAILLDLYGPQHLLRDGLLPPGIVQANPGFLRPVVGVNPPGGRFIFSLGCDLVRDAGGSWRVLADRAQAPSGHGYTLENRIVMSNVYAEEFNASRVRRLANYFELKREMLRSLAPKHRHGDAGILMLTPGPYNETYFEHAFQARYLGFPLVEGADLTVRDRHAHLKTLEGLRRVEVMVRHVDDVFCDPLELNSGSLLGTPGLMEAWRSGNIALANGLGTGVIETPALHPFMPGLCRHLLGEELKLPCVPTWWCGQRRELAMVMSDPDRWVVKPAFVRGSRDPVFIRDLEKEQKARLLDTIRAAPHEWVAQEVLSLSTTPTWTGTKMEPRSLVWRAFAISQGERFATMPGGLARVSPEPERWLVTMRSGGISKDTWVLGDGTEDTAFGHLDQQPLVIRPARPPSGVPSRAADHLFWLGRYAERLELTVRMTRVIMQRLASERGLVQSREAQSCVALMVEIGLLPKDATVLRDHLQALVQDPKREGSVPGLLSRLRYNASAARDRLSDDMWRLFNRIDRDARLPAGPFSLSAAQSSLDTLILDLAALSGMQQENMTRGHGWRFLEIGRRLERATIILTLIKGTMEQKAQDDSLLSPLLEICDSTMTYRRLHFALPVLAPVMDLLLLNDINPRSVAHQLLVLKRQAAELPTDPTLESLMPEKQQTDVLLSDLHSLNIPALARTPDQLVHSVSAICDTLTEGLEKLSDIITEHYFSHAIRRTE
ncbi:putative circularly permuted ATP-grasp superfamily protein [Prosthecobacter fusiformis]|uniref:Putative circularly permuted ATP-grasp superfamily protein n=1 Tax=Prosthecobacter fusiformis TaxID=48464 RepID=A0A4R7S5S8_9BACT|nr:circularly permuted type 2 ATP-grasp protein [Prosthecobacter fusiformis]TDU72898.1 putative circularly permuted ATP-grasp superfamily protein [Prosthecobacter fusiformis]